MKNRIDPILNVESIESDVNEMKALNDQKINNIINNNNFEEKYKNSNFIIKHWVGYFSLPVAYWFISIITTIVLTFSSKFIFEILNEAQAYNPYLIFFGFFSYWMLFISTTIWHLVGTWNSATNYSNNPAHRKSWWGGIAKLILISGAIKSIPSIFSFYPMIAALFLMSFMGDPSMPDYTITVNTNASELKFLGGIKYGAGQSLEKILSQSPNIKIIDLESPGGRIGEAEYLFNIIKSHNLNTVSNTECNSACTVVFAAGEKRWLGPEGRLGFHEGSFEVAGTDSSAYVYKVYKKVFSRLNTSSGFVKKIQDTPSTSLWYPDRSILLNENILSSNMSEAPSSINIIEAYFQDEFKNEQFPVRLDAQTILTGFRYSGYKLTYLYELNDTSLPMYRSFSNASAQLKAAISRNVCGDASVKKLLEIGAILGYEFFSKLSHQKVAYFEIDGCDA